MARRVTVKAHVSKGHRVKASTRLVKDGRTKASRTHPPTRAKAKPKGARRPGTASHSPRAKAIKDTAAHLAKLRAARAKSGHSNRALNESIAHAELSLGQLRAGPMLNHEHPSNFGIQPVRTRRKSRKRAKR